MIRRVAILLVVIGYVSFTGALAPANAGEPKTHDGFFLRLSTGVGAANSSIEAAGDKIDLHGVAADLNIAIGGVVSRDLAVHGTLWGWSMSDPEADVILGGLPGSGEINGTVTMSGVGAGLTYYVMPANLYLSGSLGFGRLNLDAGAVEGDTDNGVVMDLTIGKEWWVGDAWGLGVSGGFTFHSFPDPPVDENWSGTSFAVRFSATMN